MTKETVVSLALLDSMHVQGGPKKTDCFWELITLWRLVVEMRVIYQNLAIFI